jgi:flagellar hook-length control protein FliK
LHSDHRRLFSMNTLLLATLPAPSAEMRSSDPFAAAPSDVEGSASVAEEAPQEPIGDSDKADAFAEMLAALLGVAVPVEPSAVQAPTAVIESSSVSVTGIAGDVPRDGAGSPIFSTFTAATSTAAATAASNVSTPASASISEPLSNTAAQSNSSAIEPNATAEQAPPEPVVAPSVEPAQSAAQAARSAAQSGDDSGEKATTVPPSRLPVVGVRVTETPASVASAEANATPSAPLKSAPLASASSPPAVADAQPTVGRESSTAAGNAGITAAVSEPVEQVVVSEPVAATPAVVPADSATMTPQPEPVMADLPVDQPNEAPLDSRLEGSTAGRKPESSASAASGESVEPIPVPEAAPMQGASEGSAFERQTADTAPQAIERLRSEDRVKGRVEATASRLHAEVIDAAASTAVAPSSAGSAMNAGGISTETPAPASPVHVTQQIQQALAAYEAELPPNGTRTFEMLLDPPELGRLIVQMSRGSKGVDIRIAAENETVRSILETHAADLQQNLQLTGFDLGQFSGSSSNGSLENGHEWILAPSLSAFTNAPATVGAVTHPTNRSAVDVVV